MSLRILFVVGKGCDSESYNYRSRKPKLNPTWIQRASDHADFKEFSNEDGSVPSDVAMAYYIHSHYAPECEVVLVLGDDVASDYSVADLDAFDVIFVVFDAIEIFLQARRGNVAGMRRFERMMKQTKARVWPYPEMHKYIIEKHRYYADLKRAGIPVAPFFGIAPKTALKDPKKFMDRIKHLKWPGFIVKPNYGGYSRGIRVFRSTARTQVATVRKHFEFLSNYQFPSVTVQRFVTLFGKFFEIRSFWIDGLYAYSVATLTRKVQGSVSGLPVDQFNTFQNEGGSLSNAIKERVVKPLGRAVLQAVNHYGPPLPFVRIDVGCCMQSADCPNVAFFVNEVEVAPNTLDDHTTFPAIPEIARAFYRFARRSQHGTKRKPIRRQAPKATQPLKMCKPASYREVKEE